jgi:hypothetical protein
MRRRFSKFARVLYSHHDLRGSDALGLPAREWRMRWPAKRFSQRPWYMRLGYGWWRTVTECGKIAVTVGLSKRTLDRQWAYARAWLFRNISQEM